MKAMLVACMLALFTIVANAGTTIQLPAPTVVQAGGPQVCPVAPWSGPWFGNQPAKWTVVTGFTPAGDYVTGTAYFAAQCGHSGRAATHYAFVACESVTWDLLGNLVSVKTAPYASCYPFPALGTYTNAGCYEALTAVSGSCSPYGCSTTYTPELITP